MSKNLLQNYTFETKLSSIRNILPLQNFRQNCRNHPQMVHVLKECHYRNRKTKYMPFIPHKKLYDCSFLSEPMRKCQHFLRLGYIKQSHLGRESCSLVRRKISHLSYAVHNTHHRVFLTG